MYLFIFITILKHKTLPSLFDRISGRVLLAYAFVLNIFSNHHRNPITN